MRASVDLASELPFLPQFRQLVPGQLQVDLLDLRREGIPGGAPISNEAGNLRISFQCRPDGLNLSFGLGGRLVGHERANLFPQFLEEGLLIIEHRRRGARAMPSADNLRAKFPGRIECGYPFAHVSIAT